MNNKDCRIYLDLEYVYPEMTKEYGRPTDKNLRQVIQIAAIKVDIKTNKELETFNILCKPKYTKILPPFFTELTHITQEEVDNKGLDFLEALDMLCKFCADIQVYTMDADYSVLSQNCSYYSVKNPLKEFIRVKPMLASWGLDATKYTSGTLYKATGISIKKLSSGHVHNALHDVRSMSYATHYFTNKMTNKNLKE